ncbi:hypothetical protein VTP01DRAFT_4201 [Rhizomucor pusillus]|uniref:uncharacterized protein n=1 Tax=Rhizomucor pusillus TaxID=4840 RepID=UPI0037427661
MCIGNQGTCVGRRIKGHARRAGKNLRRQHSQYAVVALTDELRSSRTCPYCHPSKCKKKIRGTYKMVSVNGSSVCMNAACISYREHQNTQNRDELASICIAIAGYTSLQGYTMQPFNRYAAAASKLPTKNTALDPPGGAATASADVH